jgi:hypothetical protein
MKLKPAKTLAFHLDGQPSLTITEPTVTMIEEALTQPAIAPGNARKLLCALLANPAPGVDVAAHQSAVNTFVGGLSWSQLLQVHNAVLAAAQGIDPEAIAAALAQKQNKPEENSDAHGNLPHRHTHAKGTTDTLQTITTKQCAKGKRKHRPKRSHTEGDSQK